MIRRLLGAGVDEVGIERPDGPVGEALLGAGLTVYVIPPGQLKNLRGRYGSAGNKDDRFDAARPAGSSVPRTVTSPTVQRGGSRRRGPGHGSGPPSDCRHQTWVQRGRVPLLISRGGPPRPQSCRLGRCLARDRVSWRCSSSERCGPTTWVFRRELPGTGAVRRVAVAGDRSGLPSCSARTGWGRGWRRSTRRLTMRCSRRRRRRRGHERGRLGRSVIPALPWSR